ncbi:MAG TPA: radical SAM-associated putative lipoprotein [Spirochaetota bacterium]|nr:radical SAM-associated putative lipoprotein [Spirochaetota bacterium]
MKTLRKNFLKIVSGILALLFGTLGFAACYGAPPSRSYNLNGTVKSTNENKPIENISLSVFDVSSDYSLISALSDVDGSFSITMRSYSYSSDKYLIKVKDTDGEANGIFNDKDIIISFADAKYDAKEDKKEKILDINLDAK